MKKTLEDLLFEMGTTVGQAFMRGVESASVHDGGRKIAGGKRKSSLVGRIKASLATERRADRGGWNQDRQDQPLVSKACRVPSCGRQSAAKGLCSNHYAKAKRLKMNLDAKLTPAQRKTLAMDGRKK